MTAVPASGTNIGGIMAAQTGRIVGRISSYLVAGVLFVAALIAGFIPKMDSGYQVCPSAVGSIFGGRSLAQSWYNGLSGGQCNSFTAIMLIIMAVLLVLAVISLVAAILLRKRRAASPQPLYAPGYQPMESAAPFVPAYPENAPSAASAGATASSAAVPEAWRTARAQVSSASGNIDVKLLLVAVAGIAGIVLVSFVVQWLSFLPGILQLLLWTSVGLVVIWQVRRRLAGNDEHALAEAEAWNPIVVARRLVHFGKELFEAHRAHRREAERAQLGTSNNALVADEAHK